MASMTRLFSGSEIGEAEIHQLRRLRFPREWHRLQWILERTAAKRIFPARPAGTPALLKRGRAGDLLPVTGSRPIDKVSAGAALPQREARTLYLHGGDIFARFSRFIPSWSGHACGGG